MQTIMIRRALSTVFVTALTLNSMAKAQLEEVIVTAQKREQSLQDVPMAVTAIGGQILENNEINSISDLSKLVPSLKFTPGDNPTNNSIRVRGVGTDVYSSAVEPNVSVVLDNVPLARTSLANFDFADVERVEVLRGPQGTLFGKNASAGLIHIITRDPHSEFEARARYSYDNADDFDSAMWKFQASLSGPLTETLGARLTVFKKDTEGHIYDFGTDEQIPKNESHGARLKLKWDVNDVLALSLIGEYSEMDGESYPMVQRSANPGLERSNDPINASEDNRQARTVNGTVSKSDSKAITLLVDWEVAGHSLASVTGLRKADLLNDNSAAALDGANANLEFNGGPRTIETFTQELRLSSLDSDILEYTVGVLWFDNELENTFDRRVSDIPANYAVNFYTEDPVVIPMNIGSINQEAGFWNKINTQNLGIFGQAAWHLSHRWHTTMGLRYIDETLEAAYTNYQRLEESATGLPLSAADSSVSVPYAKVSDSAITGTVSLQYDLGDSSMLYATYSRGYRGRAFDVTSSSDADTFANPVEAETADSYEIGVKTRLFDDRLELNVTAFQTFFKNFQAQIVDMSEGGFTTELRLDNAGELETRGVEVDFKANPIEPVFIFGSLLYNDAEFNDFVTQCFTGQGPHEDGAIDSDGDGACDANDVEGGKLPNAPRWSGSITARYDWTLGESGRTLYGQLTGRYQSEVQFQSDQHPLTVQDAYDVWDLRVGFIGVGGRLEVSGYVKNLFEQNYVNAMFALSLNNDRRDITHFLPRDADRVVGVSVAYQW